MFLSLVLVMQLRNFGTFGPVVLHKRLLDTNPTSMLSRMYLACNTGLALIINLPYFITDFSLMAMHLPRDLTTPLVVYLTFALTVN
jgi:hypothetical protein